MDEPLEKNFVQEMRDVLQRQLSEFEIAKKKEQHDARIVADEGAKTWRELKDSLKHHVEKINEELPEAMLSYSENASGDEFTLRHELHDRTTQITTAVRIGDSPCLNWACNAANDSRNGLNGPGCNGIRDLPVSLSKNSSSPFSW